MGYEVDAGGEQYPLDPFMSCLVSHLRNVRRPLPGPLPIGGELVEQHEGLTQCIAEDRQALDESGEEEPKGIDNDRDK